MVGVSLLGKAENFAVLIIKLPIFRFLSPFKVSSCVIFEVKLSPGLFCKFQSFLIYCWLQRGKTTKCLKMWLLLFHNHQKMNTFVHCTCLKPTQGLRYYSSGKPKSYGNENLFMQIIPKQNCFGMIVSKSLNDSIYQLSNSLKSLKMFGDANSALKLKQNWHNSSKNISKFTF